MSTDRRSDRRAKRSAHSSPYARRVKSSNPPPKRSAWSISGLLSFLRFGGTENDQTEDPVRSDTSSSSSDEDEGLHVQEQEPPPSIPVRRVQIDRNSAPEFVLPLLPGDVPPGHEPSEELIYPPAWDAQPGPSNRTSQPVTPARQPLYSLNTPPQQSHIAAYVQQSPSLAKNLEPVTRFLAEKAGQPLNEFEAAGIVDYIQKNVQADKPEPFRFSTSPSRGSSPSSGLGTSNDASGDTHIPKKTLSRNPNGVLRWQGAGSARPRNRYRSPGFGSRPQVHRLKLSPPSTPSPADTKRRRVGNEAETSTAQKSAPPASASTIVFPSSSSTATADSSPTANGKTTSPPAPASPSPLASVASKVNGTATPRLRTTGVSVKPTTPAVPSPLRQAWKHSDSPPQPPTRPTHAASYMTGLIKEVTLPKKPDVSNPYQTASPVKMPARKPAARRLRTPVENKAKHSKEPEMTAQAIIEATVPKGSKRSRPPPEMEKAEKSASQVQESNAPMVNSNGKVAKQTVAVGQVLDQDESPTKKRRTATAAPPVEITVEEVMDVDIAKDRSPVITRPAEIIEPTEGAPWSPTPSAAPSSFPHISSPSPPIKPAFGVKTSAPREPSKLRYSYQAEKETALAEEKPVSPPPAPLLASRTLPKETQAASRKAKLSPKDVVIAMEIDELPTYSFMLGEATYPAGPSHVKARTAAAAMIPLSLPTFEFTLVTASTNGFNWTAAGMKAPVASASSTWSRDTCMLENPDSAKDKCTTICEAPRSSKFADAPSQEGFDWSKATIKPTDPGTWVCDVCLVPSSDSTRLTCAICDAPRPGIAAS